MNYPWCADCGRHGFARRDFLRIGSLSLLGINLSQYLKAAATGVDGKARAQSCILVWAEGGPSQVDTWDPKHNSGFKAISTSANGVQISELFPKVAQHMNKLAIIRSIRSEEDNHLQAAHYAITGHKPNPAMNFPSLGSIITREAGPKNSVPPYVIPTLGGTRYQEPFRAQFIGAQYDPMAVPDPSQKDFRIPDLTIPKSLSSEVVEGRTSLLKIVDRLYRQRVESVEHANMDAFLEQAWKMILSPAVRDAFDLSREPDKLKDAYGRSPLGMSLLLSRRLVEAGSRFVTAAGYKTLAWDTHGDNDKLLRDSLAAPLDQSLSALMQDLEERGLLQSTIVIVMGEFGRTPHINPKGGRDHWPHCWSLVVGGGGIRGGQVVGASDERGAYVADRMVSIGDIFATIYKAFGIDWRKEYMHPIGRPIKIANAIDDKTGVPIHELI